MAGLETYQEYQLIEDYEEDSPPGEEDLLIHVPEGRGGHYCSLLHYREIRYTSNKHNITTNGFACMVLSEFFELVQFLFVVTFTTFLFNCVEYDVLFANRVVNHTGQSLSPLDRNKVTLPDAILPSEQCTERSVCPLYTGTCTEADFACSSLLVTLNFLFS
uniref:Autophagy-related protein 9 n=1 Tax=Sinocyclocheilus grahami TaxID=75366 RepID=A0A672RSU9_SINGR